MKSHRSTETMFNFVYKWKRFSGLSDTGTDIYAVTASQFPSRWPRADTIIQ